MRPWLLHPFDLQEGHLMIYSIRVTDVSESHLMIAATPTRLSQLTRQSL